MDVAARIRELQKKRRKDLNIIAAQTPGVKIHKNLTKLDVAKRIANAELEQELKNPAPPTPTETPPEDPKQGGPSPLFTELAQTDSPDRPPVEPETTGPGRGGFRPGAGRKVGQTVEVCRWQHLPETPNPSILAALEGAFNMWAEAVGDQNVALTKAEAMQLALPYTQLAAAYGVNEKIHPGIVVWWNVVWTTANIGMVKARHARKAKPESFMKARLAWSTMLQKIGLAKKSKDANVTSNHHPDIREAGLGQDRQEPQPDGHL